jgi:hypothetical protein
MCLPAPSVPLPSKRRSATPPAGVGPEMVAAGDKDEAQDTRG